MSYFNDRIPVISSGNPMQTLGYILTATGMVVNFQDNYQNLTITAINEGVITATGAAGSGSAMQNYHYLTNIKESAAVALGYPTGANSFPFK